MTISRQAPRTAVRGINRRIAPTISPQPRTDLIIGGMWVLANSWRDPGARTNNPASSRITIARDHCRAVNAVRARRSLCSSGTVIFHLPLADTFSLNLLEPMAGAGVEFQAIKPSQLLSSVQRRWTERRLAIEGCPDIRTHIPRYHIRCKPTWFGGAR